MWASLTFYIHSCLFYEIMGKGINRYCKNDMTLKAILVKISATVFTELENTILKFLWKKKKRPSPQRPWVSKQP